MITNEASLQQMASLLVDLDQMVEMTIWPRDVPAGIPRGSTHQTLRVALEAASDMLAGGTLQAWITTAAGDILPPRSVAACILTLRQEG
jgi:hypothetical protein